MTLNQWYIRAQAAILAYRLGRAYRQYPAPGSVGYCARAARALWTDCNGGKPCPYGQKDADGDGDVDAEDMRLLVKRAGKLVTATDRANAYHTAAGRGLIRPGVMLFFPYGRYGHVATVVEVNGPPGESLKNVVVFENTSSGRDDGRPGTRLTRLDVVCGALGSGRVNGVGVV